jgi:hypothetical protein
MLVVAAVVKTEKLCKSNWLTLMAEVPVLSVSLGSLFLEGLTDSQFTALLLTKATAILYVSNHLLADGFVFSHPVDSSTRPVQIRDQGPLQTPFCITASNNINGDYV